MFADNAVFVCVITFAPTPAISVHEFVEAHTPDFLSILKPVSLVDLSLHPRTMPEDDIAVAVRDEGAVGGVIVDVVSSKMVSKTCVDTLPTLSLNNAYTVFVPSPDGNVHPFDVAYASHAVQAVESLIHICDMPPPVSVAAKVKVTDVVVVEAALLLIVTEPVGTLRSCLT